MNVVDEAIKELATRVTAPMGVELLDAQWAGTPRTRTLRLVVDRPGGVSVETCAAISRQFDLLWEADHGYPRDFALEVTSPGPDRPLITERDFARIIGRWVEVTYADGQDRISVVAEVAACTEGMLTLRGFEEPLMVPLDAIERAKVVFSIGKPTAKRTIRRSTHL